MRDRMKKSPHSAEFKFKVALEAIKGEKTTCELCQQYGVVSSQIFKWKKALLDKGCEVFKKGPGSRGIKEEEIHQLHAKIGRLTIENDFLERVLGRKSP